MNPGTRCAHRAVIAPSAAGGKSRTAVIRRSSLKEDMTWPGKISGDQRLSWELLDEIREGRGDDRRDVRRRPLRHSGGGCYFARRVSHHQTPGARAASATPAISRRPSRGFSHDQVLHHPGAHCGIVATQNNSWRHLARTPCRSAITSRLRSHRRISPSNVCDQAVFASLATDSSKNPASHARCDAIGCAGSVWRVLLRFCRLTPGDRATHSSIATPTSCVAPILRLGWRLYLPLRSLPVGPGLLRRRIWWRMFFPGPKESAISPRYIWDHVALVVTGRGRLSPGSAPSDVDTTVDAESRPHARCHCIICAHHTASVDNPAAGLAPANAVDGARPRICCTGTHRARSIIMNRASRSAGISPTRAIAGTCSDARIGHRVTGVPSGTLRPRCLQILWAAVRGRSVTQLVGRPARRPPAAATPRQDWASSRAESPRRPVGQGLNR